MARSRIDVALVERGLFPSREQARAALIAGEVRVGDRIVTKPGQPVDAAADITVAQRPRFVSRGGEKISGALDAFGVDVSGLRIVDVGASTGGFTDCVLQRGAASVCAVDVGYGQLAWPLRGDPRVAVFERTNIREADPSLLGAPFDLAMVDVSFISLRKVLPNVIALIDSDRSQMLALVKPQFEVGKGKVGKRGVVRDAHQHVEVLEMCADACSSAGLVVRGLTFSPVKGPEGNIEFWMWAAHHGLRASESPAEVVAAAHARLGG